MEAKFVDGNLSGLVKLTGWFENGKKSVESHYLNNQIHGRYTQWTEQGKVVWRVIIPREETGDVEAFSDEK